MKAKFHVLTMALVAAVASVCLPLPETIRAAQPDEKTGPGPGPIVNQAADAVFGCLVPPFKIDGTNSRESLVEAFEKLVDRYADARVPYLFLNVNYQRTAYCSQAWDAYWDNPNPDSLSDWPRLSWLVHRKDVDPYAVCIRRCRERGVSPWISIRMNDTHYIDDPTKTSTLWQKHPELRRTPNGGFDFGAEKVRDYHLALIGELLARYDCDGLELDWMRFPWHFKPGQEEAGREHLTDFIRQARTLADRAAAKRKHPVMIAARIPAVPQFSRGLGMDGVVWAREGLVDMLILASVWRPSDTDIPVETWRELIGPEGDKIKLAAGTDLWIQGTPGGVLMKDDVETQRGFTAAMLHRGADLIYLFNHFNMNDFRYTDRNGDGRQVVRDENHALLSQAGRMEAVIDKPRRHVVTFHDPAPPGADNPKQLPASLSIDQAAKFRIYIGPKPLSGSAVIRAGLDDAPDLSQAQLGVRINSVACRGLADLSKPGDFVPRSQRGTPVVSQVAELAPRVVQFDAPITAMRQGYNTVDISLVEGHNQKIIWLEIRIVP
jgi:hypothetical protein